MIAKEISTDAELIKRLLSMQPTPAECLVAAARIEQLCSPVTVPHAAGVLIAWRDAQIAAADEDAGDKLAVERAGCFLDRAARGDTGAQ